MTENVQPLKPWETVAFPWGAAVRHRNGRWEKIFISPDAQEINVSNLNVILHDNGIEFITKTMR